MTTSVLTYSPSDVKIIISGFTLSGLNSIVVRWNTAPFKPVKGIRGVNTRVANKDRSAVITIEMLQTSPTNELLFEIIRQDAATYGGRLNLAVVDHTGQTMVQSSSAYLSEYPELIYGMDFNSRRWVFNIQDVIGGVVAGSRNSADNLLDALGARVDNALGNIRDGISSIF